MKHEIELDDSEISQMGGTYRQAQLKRQHAVRAYGAGTLGLVTLLAVLRLFPGVQVMDAERPRGDLSATADNRYLLVRFKSDECPAALRGVTKLDIGGCLITIHHFLAQQRIPCARCYVPFHTTGFCKANPAQVERLQIKHKRTYAGHIPDYSVGEAVQYRHSDGESLSTFLSTLHEELAGALEKLNALPASAQLVAPVATPSLNQTGQREAHAPAERLTNPATPEGKTSGDGFHTASRKRSKAKLQTTAQPEAPISTATPHKSQTPRRAGVPTSKPLLEVKVTAASTGSKATAKTPHNGKMGLGNNKGRRKGTVAVPTFHQFTHERDQGRFAVLTEDLEDSDATMRTRRHRMRTHRRKRQWNQ